MLYILTTKLEGKQGYGPVAVVDDEHIANEWIRVGGDNDWVPLELNDLSTTGLGVKQTSPFKPVPAPRRVDQQSDQAEQTRKTLEEANRLLQNAVKRRRIMGHAKRAGRREEVKAFYEGRAQSILNAYLMDRAEGERDPEIYDFLDYLKSNYRANVPADEYEILVDVLYSHYKSMFGNK
jgi:hypothetical protein